MVDFTSRNGLDAAHRGRGHPRRDRRAIAFRVEAMERTLDDLWAPQAHWCHFSLNGRRGPYRFPASARTQVPAPAGEGPA